MDLSGVWRAAPADQELHLRFSAPDFDDENWSELAVPGHWQTDLAFADVTGSVMYRRQLESNGPNVDRRAWLVLDGVFQQSDIWLDGLYLGDTEGYFAPHAHEITQLLGRGREHVLAMEVTCPAPERDAPRRNLMGAFDMTEVVGPGATPGGIWRPVRIQETGPVRITDLRVLCTDTSEQTATLVLRARLDSDRAGSVDLVTIVAPVGANGSGGIDDRQSQPMAEGENQVEWTITITDPDLWWPHALGEQPLYEVAVEAHAPDLGLSDRRQVTTGLRSLEIKNWKLSINGERLFCKGINLLPNGPYPGATDPAVTKSELDRVVELGADMVALYGHVAPPHFYNQADERGLLVWQDLPLLGAVRRGAREKAAQLARAAVGLLSHHPSVAIWCGHRSPAGPAGGSAPSRQGARRVLGDQLPSWNRSVLDRSIGRTLERHDGSRPTVSHSGVGPHLPQLDGTDSHLWFGWHRGDERDLPQFAARFPNAVRWVSEMGAQSVPGRLDSQFGERWPALDWARLTEEFGAQLPLINYTPLVGHDSFHDWMVTTQKYQAMVVRRGAETLRRLKYRPTGGVFVHHLRDAHPQVGFALIDDLGNPKAAFDALAKAYRETIVVADRFPAQIAAGEALALDVHIVHDGRHSLDEMVVTADLEWPDGRHRWRWTGNAGPDSVVRVGTINWIAPATPGPVSLILSLNGDTIADNRYDSVII